MRKEQVEFIVLLSREFPDVNRYLVGNFALRMMALARKAERNATNGCNIPDYKDRTKEIADQVTKTIHEWEIPSFGFVVGGDPRGYCLKLHLPSGAHNTLGGKEDGYGVPC